VKILLVDDSPVMLGYLGALLKRRGHEVSTADSLAKALEGALSGQPDAVLMDLILEPGRTGLEALSAIFSLCDTQARPRPRAAILTAGRMAPADEARAASLGATVLQKPERGREEPFLQSVDNWLRV
jgi:CheY-like chemotaxis protein